MNNVKTSQVHYKRVPVQSEEKTHDEESRAAPEESVPEEREREGSTRHEDRSILAHMSEARRAR